MVHSFCNVIRREVGRKDVLVFKRIMPLGIRHRTGVKPHVDQVGFAEHFFSLWGNQDDLVYIRTVQVQFLARIRGGSHEACSN